jgi:hypothetical protein
MPRDTRPLIAASMQLAKPRKETARNIIRELFLRHPEDIGELAKIYKFFAPPPVKKVKNAFDWVAQAVDPRHTYDVCRYVIVKNGEAFATNLVRMHVAMVDMPDGCYNRDGDLVAEETEVQHISYVRYRAAYDQPARRIAKLGEIAENNLFTAYEAGGFHYQTWMVDQALTWLENPELWASNYDNLIIKSGENYALIFKVLL